MKVRVLFLAAAFPLALAGHAAAQQGTPPAEKADTTPRALPNGHAAPATPAPPAQKPPSGKAGRGGAPEDTAARPPAPRNGHATQSTPAVPATPAQGAGAGDTTRADSVRRPARAPRQAKPARKPAAPRSPRGG